MDDSHSRNSEYKLLPSGQGLPPKRPLKKHKTKNNNKKKTGVSPGSIVVDAA